MKVDGSDVKTSSDVTLDVQDAGGGKLRLKFSGVGGAIDVAADELRDGITGASLNDDNTRQIRVFFDGSTVYGWCQNAGDNEMRAFWLTK